MKESVRGGPVWPVTVALLGKREARGFSQELGF